MGKGGRHWAGDDGGRWLRLRRAAPRPWLGSARPWRAAAARGGGRPRVAGLLPPGARRLTLGRRSPA
jgi:hypothetical protein